jgi:hypothetical protein
MNDKESMTLALELFEQFGRDSRLKYEHQAIYKTIVALKEALAKQEQRSDSEHTGEPVAFKIYKPTPPRHAIPNVRDAELPWVYDQDPSSGNVASMWVTPVQTLRSKNDR